MRFDNALIVDNQSVVLTIQSSAITLESMYTYAIQCVFTGAPNGSVKLQGSCDPGKYINTSTGRDIVNWTDIDGTSTAVVAAGSVMYNMDAQGYKWVRLVYTASSGTGNLSARFNGKGV